MYLRMKCYEESEVLIHIKHIKRGNLKKLN